MKTNFFVMKIQETNRAESNTNSNYTKKNNKLARFGLIIP